MSSHTILQQRSLGFPWESIDPFLFCVYLDHADSLGATARFGKGDVQWGTAWRGTEISGIAGRLVDAGIDTPLPPPPHSWAAQPEAEVAVGTLKMAPGAGGP